MEGSGRVVLHECEVHGDVQGEVMSLTSHTPRLVRLIVCLKTWKIVERKTFKRFTLFATISQVSSQGMSTANSYSVSVWIFRDNLPSGYAKQVEKSGPD